MDINHLLNTASVEDFQKYIYFPFIILICLFILYIVIISLKGVSKKKFHFRDHKLDRHDNNPIISPLKFREWEANGTFNPAAVEDDEGCVHLLYRAIGEDGLSNIGHSSSRDGKNFKRRSAFPVYRPDIQKAKTDTKPEQPSEYNPSLYYSGGGWGGYEDPRTVRMNDRVYMTYTAFNGWHSVRLAISSIKLDDLKKERWNWTKPFFLSPENEVHKNWVLFPEKINGKFAILHGICPNVLIEYVDDIDKPYKFKPIKSKPPKGGREGYWDNWVRGAGPPPIKTDFGWLLLYHAMDKNDPNKYKVGAMILDLREPTKILYRSPQPILSPDMHYENDGKPGVVYATGALVKNGELFIYYGGGDKHSCVAQTPLKDLLNYLVVYGK